MVFLAAAKRIVREHLKQCVPELADVVLQKNCPKQAVKNTMSDNSKKQTRGDYGKVDNSNNDSE